MISNTYFQHNAKTKQRIGFAIRHVRNANGYSSEYMARKLGYTNNSTYCKIERGELKILDIDLLINICDLLNCSIFHLIIIADFDIIDTKIKSWTEFFFALKDLDRTNNQKIERFYNEFFRLHFQVKKFDKNFFKN